jgi:ParB-like chromosome segregation protein Spo0J
VRRRANLAIRFLLARNELIDGGTRYEAAKQLGLARVSCVRIDHLSLDDELARVIA